MSTRKPPSTPLVVILGSTGTGKSELAVDLAVRFDGEIVNADAMQMYNGLPIITNKISHEEQRSIPHHLLGNISLDEETWIVGVFKKKASKIIQEIRSRGRLPIVVGGTHYYTQALLFRDNLIEANNETPEQLPGQDKSAEFPILNDTTEAMWKRLKEVDPVMADRWHPNDRRKIHRSLEIFLTTGKRASDIYAEQQKRKAQQQAVAKHESDPQPGSDPLLFWVHTEDQALKDRLNRRVDKMLEAGLMDEIAKMNNYLQSTLQAAESVDFTRGIWQSIGFKEFQPYLRAVENGMDGPDLESLKLECLEKMKTATRRYARYQMKWIAKQTIPLLQGEGNFDRLYVLDSTDVTQFTKQVIDQAADVTRKFLAGEDLPAPSETAREVLKAAEAANSAQDTPCRRYCDLCDATLLSEEAWVKHIRGKAHRRQVRHRKRTALVPVECVDAEVSKVETNLGDWSAASWKLSAHTGETQPRTGTE
ncbi:tRNA isopentenyltransferase [Cryphonectria parasitica EP155]|uniref:tRNA dimethylallyltransferase n=1 Tax=Cryphonectria parasitica (strain ATCC 38755 / EP155) TaxID=660469 RepID=A0A9P5CHH3_CRYP1|nr:tRNA isopentenyltransferase [Cryphonectria parasitica EP155]KAF3760159.1 tRNA isopentenyltransferase [Cryphonectria parasitica EP155]